MGTFRCTLLNLNIELQTLSLPYQTKNIKTHTGLSKLFSMGLDTIFLELAKQIKTKRVTAATVWICLSKLLHWKLNSQQNSLGKWGLLSKYAMQAKSKWGRKGGSDAHDWVTGKLTPQHSNRILKNIVWSVTDCPKDCANLPTNNKNQSPMRAK